MKHLLMKLTNILPDESENYPSWLLWLLVAGFKTVAYTNYRTAKSLYWSKKATQHMKGVQ